MLRIEGLTVALGGRRVLHGIDLAVAAGEVVALEGPSGAGKTTLLRAIAGLVPVAAGRIGRGSPAALVFQQHALAARLSARDNVLVGALGRIGFWRAALRAWPRAELAEAAACLARVGLDGLGPRRADRLSGGQRQRVAVARALMQRAMLLLADEPVASLDPENARAVLDLLRGLARREGRAVLVTLHQPDLAGRIADRRLRMEEGRLWPV
ncbi:phosphonate ABC transporter ATP-binding protein [Paracraurococcus lichenis]|uniref:ATP-binding cassette domain-containing protein n=1 Tax=Paracraurococcus lichenis TaxID=3064888 RepID=A0ABT9ECB5_9PROT|nr:ATP-binding cassette domain-containing protein [Paracraurococcus sp. LOR1-02]MDO9713863.1 ATP-binding cassette domain-containing protein [Paracraurococcus sp. LOR1-02]